MRKRLLLFLSLLTSGMAFGQNAAQYIFNSFPGTYTDLVAGTQVSTIQQDDNYAQSISIGFTFNFCGTNYTTVSVSSNGWLSFQGNPGGNYLTNDLTNLANIVPALMPLWDDLDGNAGGAGFANYKTSGTAPFRTFTFEWRNWEWQYSANVSVISLQVKLYETTNMIEFIYRQEANAPVNPSASIGIAKTTSDYQSLPTTGTNPTPSPSSFTNTLSSAPATGQIYQWRPPIYTPVVTGGGNFCAGDTVRLVAQAPSVVNPSFYWTKGNNPTILSTSSTYSFVGTPPASGAYSVRVISTLPGGVQDTSGPGIAVVQVNPIPPPPIVSPQIYYCQGQTFDSIDIVGENLKWYTVATGGIPGPKPVINTSIAATYTFYVSQTISGCEGPRAPITVTVSPKPLPPSVVSPVGYCQDMPATALVANGQNVRWYSIPSGGIGSSVAPVPSTAAQGSFTWYASQTIAGCESKRVPVIVNVSYVPNGLITINRPYVCQYDTISLGYFGNALTTASYVWDLPAGANIVSGSGQGPLVIRFDSAGAQTVKLTIDNGGCVGPQATLAVPVHVSPRLTIDTQPDACIDQTVSLAITYSTLGIDSFAWDFSGAELVYGSMPRGPFGLRWNSAGEKPITVIATDDGCKSLPSYDTIQIHNSPDATITASLNSICAGDSVMFTAPYEPGASYQWLPLQFFGETHNNTVWGSIDFTRQVVLNVTNVYNCKSTDSITIEAKPCCQVYFPNAFTPNGDGNNDRFRILTMGKDQNSRTSAHQISVFRVQNRWGQTVFETADERTGWDGTYNGEPQDMGIYYYYVKYKCSDGKFYEDKGELTLIR